MKLIIAILHQEDEPLAVEDLNKKGFFVTKLATTGGFFKNHNVTLLIGTQDHLVSDAITILHKDAGKRQEPRYYPQPSASGPHCSPAAFAIPVETETGGCTIFVLDMIQFEKI